MTRHTEKKPDWEGFGRAIMDGWPEPYGEMMDGIDLQDIAERYGVLVGTEVTERCCDYDCNCVEYGFPVTCYRVVPETKP